MSTTDTFTTVVVPGPHLMAALLGQRIGIGFGHRDLKDRIVGNLAWKAHHALDDVEEHHIVRFEALGGMDRAVLDTQKLAKAPLPAPPAINAPPRRSLKSRSRTTSTMEMEMMISKVIAAGFTLAAAAP